MDALSEVLRLSRFTAGVTLDAATRAPWCVSVPASGAVARAHLVVEGQCVVRTGLGDEVALKAGELALVPRGDAHVIGSAIGDETVSLASLLKTPVAGAMMAIRLRRLGGGPRRIPLTGFCERP